MWHMVTPLNPEAFENLRLELRRGCLVLAVLAALRSEQYGGKAQEAFLSALSQWRTGP